MGHGRLLRAALTLVVALVVAAPAHAAVEERADGAASAGPAPRADATGQVIAVFEESARPSERADARADADTTLETALGRTRFQLLDVEPGQSRSDALAELRAHPAVEAASPDGLAEPMAADPLLGQLWGLDNAGTPIGGALSALAGADISAFDAWQNGTGSSAAPIAVIDSGHRFEHPDLAANSWSNTAEAGGTTGVDDDANGFVDDVRGWDFVGQSLDSTFDNNDADPNDDDYVTGGHGVHVAGTIGAVGDNGIGLTGVAKQTSIMPLRVCSHSVSTGRSQCTFSGMIGAINYAGRMGARAANMSLGGTSPNAALTAALAANPQTLFVVSAGNDALNTSTTPTYPCSIDPTTSGVPGAVNNVVCVAATTQSDQLASFSNYGTTHVDVGAPGTEILSAYVKAPVAYTETFETDDFATKWSTTGAQGFERAAEGNLIGHAITDTAGRTAAPDTVYESTSAAVTIPAGLTGCRLYYWRNLSTPNAETFQYIPMLDGVELGTYSGTAQGINRPFGQLEGTLAAGGQFQLRVRFTTKAAPTPASGVWLDDFSLECFQAVGFADQYAFLAGTSMAAPHVTGAAALLFSRKPDATVLEVREALLSSVDPVAALATTTVTGGRVNADAAFDALDVTAPATSASGTAYTDDPALSIPYTASDVGKGLDVVRLFVRRPGDTAFSLAATDSTPTASESFSYTAAAGDGAYAFFTRGKDKARNEEAEASSPDVTVTLDRLDPTSAADAPAHAAAGAFDVAYAAAGTGSPLAQVELLVRKPGSGSFVSAGVDATPATADAFSFTPDAGDGEYAFITRATDAAGNTETVPGTADDVTLVDTAPPTSSAAPATVSGTRSLTIPFTAGDGSGSGLASVALYVRGPGETVFSLAQTDTAPVGSSFAYEAPADGSYAFYTRATDVAGNQQPAPGAPDGTSLVDTIDPASAANVSPLTNDASMTVGYTATETGSGLDAVELWVRPPGAGTFTLAQTDATPSPSGTFTYPATAGDGEYAFYTRASDGAGNIEAAPATRDDATVLDTELPTSTASAPAGVADPAIDVEYEADGTGTALDDVELWVRRPGETAFSLATSVAGPATDGDIAYTAAAEGTYAFAIRARDAAGNQEPVPSAAESSTVFAKPQSPVQQQQQQSGPAGGSFQTVASTVSGAVSRLPVLAPLACSNRIVATPGRRRTLGTAAGDLLVGTAKADTLDGGAGDDCLEGLRGDDRLGGGNGADKLRGGAGKDRLTGGAGRDRLEGGAGDDTVAARDGEADTVACGAGRDRATVDATDKVSGCETVRRPRARRASGRR